MQRGSSQLDVSIDLDAKLNRGTFSATDLGALDIPLSNLQLAPALHWELVGDATTTVFDASLHGNMINGAFHEKNSYGTFNLHRVSQSVAKPYAVEQTSFESGGVHLAGSIYVPQSAGKHPAIVFVHGSGAEGRWATAYLADYVARHGIVALSYDKRGVGASTGDWRRASLQDLAGDARAAVHTLWLRSDVDRTRVGVYGHSQGAEIAPAIAFRNPEVTWLVAADGPVGPQYNQDLFRVDTYLRQHYSGQELIEAERVYAEFVDTARNGTSHDQLRMDMKEYAAAPWLSDLAIPDDGNWIWDWYRKAGNYDNSQAWKAVRVPVLILFGADDALVPVQQSVAETLRLLKYGGNRKVWARVFPEADHTLRIPPATADGWPHNAPGFLDMLTTFAANPNLNPRT
jgi:pimeloyl-ACP methyl ester carboxylesterase